MPRPIRTPAQNRDFWLTLAERYEKEAGRARTTAACLAWSERADEARAKAAKHAA